MQYLFVLFFFSLSLLRAHDVRASATFTVHYPSTLGISSNVYERQHLCGSIVIAWGVLFANSFIVFFSSYNSRFLFFCNFFFFFLQITGAHHTWIGDHSEHIYQAFNEAGSAQGIWILFCMKQRRRTGIAGSWHTEGEAKQKPKMKTNAEQLYKGIGL